MLGLITSREPRSMPAAHVVKIGLEAKAFKMTLKIAQLVIV